MIEDYWCYGCGGINLKFLEGNRVRCLDCGRDWYETRTSILDQIKILVDGERS